MYHLKKLPPPSSGETITEPTTEWANVSGHDYWARTKQYNTPGTYQETIQHSLINSADYVTINVRSRALTLSKSPDAGFVKYNSGSTITFTATGYMIDDLDWQLYKDDQDTGETFDNGDSQTLTANAGRNTGKYVFKVNRNGEPGEDQVSSTPVYIYDISTLTVSDGNMPGNSVYTTDTTDPVLYIAETDTGTAAIDISATETPSVSGATFPYEVKQGATIIAAGTALCSAGTSVTLNPYRDPNNEERHFTVTVDGKTINVVVFKCNIVAYEGYDNATEIDEDYEENPGCYVGWNADGADNLVKIDLKVTPLFPSGTSVDYKLKVESLDNKDGRIKIWAISSPSGTAVLDGTGELSLPFSGGTELLGTYFVEGKVMSSLAGDVQMTFMKANYTYGNIVRFSVLGIEAVKDRENYEDEYQYVPLVRNNYEINNDVENIELYASEMKWSIHIFQPGAGNEAGSIIESLDSTGSLLDGEYGDSGELDVEGYVTDHYVGWDYGGLFGDDTYHGFVVDTMSLSDAITTLYGKENGTIDLISTEAESYNKIEEFGNNTIKVLASNLILKYNEAGDEVFEMCLQENNDDDDRNGNEDNTDEEITGDSSQKTADIGDMAYVKIDQLTPSAALAPESIKLSQVNAGDAGAGTIRLFKKSDMSLFWTSGTTDQDMSGLLSADIEFYVEGVVPGEVILKLEYTGNGIAWFDKVRIFVVDIDVDYTKVYDPKLQDAGNAEITYTINNFPSSISPKLELTIMDGNEEVACLVRKTENSPSISTEITKYWDGKWGDKKDGTATSHAGKYADPKKYTIEMKMYKMVDDEYVEIFNNNYDILRVPSSMVL